MSPVRLSSRRDTSPTSTRSRDPSIGPSLAHGQLRRIVARWKTQSMDSRRSPWRLCTLLLILGLAPGASAQTEPRHVLLLYSYEREFTHTAFAGMFRPELTRSSAEPVDYIEVALQTAGESVRAPDDSIVTRLGSTFAGTRLDLVVAIGGPAAAFAQEAPRAAVSHDADAVRCRGSSLHREGDDGRQRHCRCGRA